MSKNIIVLGKSVIVGVFGLTTLRETPALARRAFAVHQRKRISQSRSYAKTTNSSYYAPMVSCILGYGTISNTGASCSEAATVFDTRQERKVVRGSKIHVSNWLDCTLQPVCLFAPPSPIFT